MILKKAPGLLARVGILWILLSARLEPLSAAETVSSPASAIVAERDLSRPIVLGAADAFQPYSYIDSDGVLKGFCVELTDAVGRVMNLKFQREAIGSYKMSELLLSGQIDVVQSWSESAARRSFVDFSVPYAEAETIVVVRKGDDRIRTLNDLQGLRVAVGQKTTIGDNFLREQQPGAIPVYTETTGEFLRLLSAGQCDAAVMSRLTAVLSIDELNLKNLHILDLRVPGYEVRYCMAVRKGDALLLARLNEGLAILHRTGEYQRIYQKWFGRYIGRTFTTTEVASYIFGVMALALVAVSWGYFRQRRLSRRIVRQSAELVEHRSLLAALHDSYPLATIVLEDPQAPKLLSFNPEAAQLFNLAATTVPGTALADLHLSVELSDYFKEVMRRWRTHQLDREMWEWRRAKTRQYLETILVSLDLGATATAPRLCVLTSDVTRRRLLDHEVGQSRRLRALGELVGGIAHEFNNLLTPIIGTTSMVQSELADRPQLQADLSLVSEAARRAAELTRRLLTFGRKAGENLQPVTLVEAVENCQALLRPAMDRRIVWENHVSPDLPPLIFNPTDLAQILFNLILNARDTLTEKLAQTSEPGWTPRLVVTAEELPVTIHTPELLPPGGTLVAWQQLTVEDNGLGIPAANLERIYEPFFTTKDVGKGTGLGLATVWHQVNDIGGTITVQSRPGEGSRFQVLLPRWRIKSADDAPRSVTNPPLTAGASRQILLVEDEVLVARSALAILRHAGHTVTHKADGQDALDHLAVSGAEYDVYIVDADMPRLNGVDFIQNLRRDMRPGRIIISSGRLDEADRLRLRELKVDQVLSKPYNPVQLLAMVQG